MKNKTIVKIFTIALLFIVLASSASVVFAENPEPEPAPATSSGQKASDLNSLITGQSQGEQSSLGNNAKSASSTVVGVVQIVGVAVAVIMLIWLGVKYVSAAPNEKADIKKGAMIYVVGAAFILAASAFLSLIQNWTKTL